MARIIVRRTAGGRRRVASLSGVPRPLQVRIVGRLRASDLGRLEAACGPALEHEQLALELDVGGVEALDSSAVAYLRRLRARVRLFSGAYSCASSRR